jgi:putative Holliday junction resolvase
MAGEEQEMSRLASKFSNQLRGRLNIIVHEIDERMTSIEAEQIIRDNNRNNQGKKLSAEERDIDAVAATQILQSWLNN